MEGRQTLARKENRHEMNRGTEAKKDGKKEKIIDSPQYSTLQLPAAPQ